jgi:hypothetical protein
MKRLACLALLLVGCSDASSDVDVTDEELAQKATEEWFYTGPMPALEQPHITVSLEGNTARLSGLLPVNATLPALPHVKTIIENGRTRVDAVYPIATARPGKTNSSPGTYHFQLAIPYRPDGVAWTPEEGNHFVTWGGFPFISYNNGIAFHGPITPTQNISRNLSVWVLKRGDVSGGCNRMLGEHVLELAHAIGIDMRKSWIANKSFVPGAWSGSDKTKLPAVVDVISGYDEYEGQLVDVDYPTDVGVVRPKGNVVMFGSWVASELPNGKDLPPSLNWEGGVSGNLYVFAEHAVQGSVCSVKPADLPLIRARGDGRVPADFCENKACYLAAYRANAPLSCP